MKAKFDITIAGIPIGGRLRVTPETLDAFRRARIILDLTSNPWPFKEVRSRVVDLDKYYWTGELDEVVYTRIADLVLEEGRKGPGVVLAVDGNPGIYQDLSWDIKERGKRLRLRVNILPAVSCLDAMVAFCGLQLGAPGLQIVEATTIVGYNIRINPFLDLLIMQVGWFGTSILTETNESKRARFEPLIAYLLKYYPRDQPVKIFRVAPSPAGAAQVISTRLSKLHQFHRSLTSDATLYIPQLDPDGDEKINVNFLAQTEAPEHLTKIAKITNHK